MFFSGLQNSYALCTFTGNLKDGIMSEQDDAFAYDEDEAIRYIRNVLPQDIKEKYSDDDIMYITDVVYEFYEKKGLFNASADEEVELDEDEIIDYALKCIHKDGMKFDDDDVAFLVRGELDYEESLGVF